MFLLLDTSTPVCRLTIYDAGTSHLHEWQADRELAHHLHRFARDCLAEHDLDWSDIRGLGIMRGPGSYTGLRIGITVWNTLAESLVVPIVGEMGDDWQGAALERLKKGMSDQLVLPYYDGDANITKPRK